MSTLRQARADDIARLKSLTDENFGVDYYTVEYLQSVLDSKDKRFYVYTDDNDVPIAYQYMIVTDWAQARKLLKITLPVPELEQLDDNTTVAIYKTSCTDKRYRGRGIFKLLVSSVEAYLSQHGIKILMGDAMRHPDGFIPVESSVLKLGFKPSVTIPHPWSDIDAYCPYCKQQFCQCDALLYIKELEYA